jgi:hypothetical protein
MGLQISMENTEKLSLEQIRAFLQASQFAGHPGGAVRGDGTAGDL